jgi:hypothetical protein
MDNYKEIALYFADILAASAEHALSRSSTPQTERRRQLAIMDTVCDSLEARVLVRAVSRKEDAILSRAQDILIRYKIPAKS